MATIKAHTDLEQARTLLKILPHKSADMSFNAERDYEVVLYPYMISNWIGVPCWSLAALLNVLPVSCDDGQHCLALINSNPNGDTEWLCCYEDCKGHLMMECYGDNQIDACVAMIEKLHKIKML